MLSRRRRRNDFPKISVNSAFTVCKYVSASHHLRVGGSRIALETLAPLEGACLVNLKNRHGCRTLKIDRSKGYEGKKDKVELIGNVDFDFRT